MTYQLNTQRNKVPNAILEQNKQENTIFLQQWIKGKIENQVKSVNPSNTILSNVSLNSPWYVVDLNDGGPYNTGTYAPGLQSIYKTWRDRKSVV